MTWDGTEIRKMNQADHDLLVEIHSDMKHLVENFKSHVVNDEKQFKDINNRLKWAEKLLWGCIGGFTLLQIVLRLIK